MKYLITQFKVTPDKKKVYDGKILKHRWDGDHQFSFDINDPKKWWVFLSKLLIDGKPLPRDDGHGTMYRYRVYSFGGNVENVKTYFPARDKNDPVKSNYYIVSHGKLESLSKVFK